MRKSILRIFTELSSNKALSSLAGRFAKSGSSKRMIRRFARTYGIALEEAEKDLAEYATLNEFFTRRLKPGARPADAEPDRLVSPVDAVITAKGPIHDGLLMNIKGQDYSIDELLNHSPRVVNYRNGYYFVLYLSPTDYHRIHSPVDGRIVEKEHVPGKVYPVREFSLRSVPKVLSRNERQLTYIRHEYGEIAVAKVGALNIRSVQYVEELTDTVTRGGELAYFEFGSTIVLLTESGTFSGLPAPGVGEHVRVGQSLGTLHKKSES